MGADRIIAAVDRSNILKMNTGAFAMNVVSVIDEIPDDHIAQNNMADFSVNENSGRFFDKRFFHSGVFQLSAFRQTDEVFRFEMRVRLLGGNLSADHDRPFSGGELRRFFKLFRKRRLSATCPYGLSCRQRSDRNGLTNFCR